MSIRDLTRFVFLIISIIFIILGPCVDNLCQPGYACNTNNFCCSLGSGSVLGPCVNGQCPAGYACGAGNLCYPVTAGGSPLG